MRLKASIVAVTSCLLASLTLSAVAQTAATNGYPSISNETHGKDAYPKRRESSDVVEGQRALAVSKLNSLAEEANGFKDQTLRVRIQARAADALWEIDRVQSRRLFLRAWDIAESVDKAGTLTAEDESKKALTPHQGLTFVPPPPNLRSEVLDLAARRDQQLAESLLSRLEEAKESETKSGDGRLSFFDPTEPPQAIAKRLELATELLKAGEVGQAKGIADPGLKYATTQGIIFLSALRQKDAEAADARFTRLLALSASDQRSDATTVSLLSSYIFTPNLIVTATRRGRVSNQWSEQAITITPPETLRSSFLRVAAGILLRPLPTPDQDSTSAGRGGAYFTITRLLPMFGQYAPDYLPDLNARLTLLAQDTLPVYKTNDNGMLTAGLVPNDSGSDELSAILGRLSSVVGVGEKDVIYLKAVRAAAVKGDVRIREFADQIDNAEVKRRARAFADFVTVRKALADKNVDGALRIIREGDLQPLQRVWAYSEAARLLNESDIPRSTQLLEEAASEAQKINTGELDRVYALACVASRFLRVDPARAWEIASDVVKASNDASDFDADDGKLTARLQARGVVAMESFSVPSFNLTNLFASLAKEDYQRVEALAETLKGEAPRATAKLALARALLRKKGD